MKYVVKVFILAFVFHHYKVLFPSVAAMYSLLLFPQ